MELSLEFKDNDTLHEDLILRFAGELRICDSYYLALDPELLPEREDAGKVPVVLRRLLEQWLSAVENVSDGGTVFLPFDFSDQSTNWIRCHRSGAALDLCLGWAELEGWSFPPSAVGDYLTQLRGFRPDGPATRVPLGETVEAIRESLTSVA